MKTVSPLPLHLCEMQGRFRTDAFGHPLPAEELGFDIDHHSSGPRGGLHLVTRGIADLHVGSDTPMSPQRSRLGKAMDVMLGRADVRPARFHLKQSWRA